MILKILLINTEIKMAYKILKKEFVRIRPKWLSNYLLSLSPSVYQVHHSLSDAEESLSYIKKTFGNMYSKTHSLNIFSTDDLVEIRSQKNRPFVRFRIDRNYNESN